MRTCVLSGGVGVVFVNIFWFQQMVQGVVQQMVQSAMTLTCVQVYMVFIYLVVGVDNIQVLLHVKEEH